MKNINKLLILSLSTLFIASCGGKTNSSSDSNSENSITNTNTTPSNTTPVVNYGTFPYAELNEYAKDSGVTIPGMYSEAEWHFTTGEDEYGEYALAGTVDTDLSIERAYFNVITEAGWIDLQEDYDAYGYIFDDPTESFEAQFFSDGGYFYLYIFPIEVYESDIDGFDFTTEGQITSKSDTSATWVYGDYKMTVTKGSASVNVGNGDKFAGPLRLYVNQVVTFTWTGTNPSYFAAKVDLSLENTKSTVAAGSDTSTGFSITNGTVRVDGETIYYSPTGNSKSLSITIGSKQCHWEYVIIG